MIDEQKLKEAINTPLQEPGTIIKLSTLIKLHSTMSKINMWLDTDAKFAHPNSRVAILKNDVKELMVAVQKDIADYRKLVEQGL